MQDDSVYNFHFFSFIIQLFLTKVYSHSIVMFSVLQKQVYPIGLNKWGVFLVHVYPVNSRVLWIRPGPLK